MTSSSKDRGSTTNGRDDCQIHVDKEGESCVIKIESVGQEKMLKELLGRFNSLKTEVNQLLSGQQKQQQPKEMFDAIQDITAKLKPLENQLEKVNKHVGDDHIQLNKLHTDLNKKFDEIKQYLNSFKEQQKNLGISKDTMEKILHKLDNLDKIVKNSQDEGQKRFSNDLQNLKHEIPLKNDIKPILDAIQNFQLSFDKEKTKPDILARKIDAIDQKLKESHPEHMAVIKDIQTKFNPLHKSTSQTNEILTKLNDRIETIHTNTSKIHPDIIQKLDHIDQNLKTQSNSLIEPMKQILNEKLNPFFEQQKKDGEEKFDSPNKDNNSHSPNRVPLCINGMIPNLNKIFHSYLLQILADDIAKKLTDIQIKLPSSEDSKRKQDDFIGNLIKQQTPLIDEIKRLTTILDKLKQQDLFKNIEIKLNNLLQNLEKENNLKKQVDTQSNITKEISNHTQSLQQTVENLSKQQQPFIEIIRDLPKKLDNIHQFQIQGDLIKEFSSKFDALIQTIQAIKDDLNHQIQNKNRDNEILINLEKKLNQILIDSSKRLDNNQDIEKALQPFSHIIKTLKDNIEQSQTQEIKKFDNFEQYLSKSSDILEKLNEITRNFKQTNPTMQKLSDEIELIKNLIEKQSTSEDLLAKITEYTQKEKAPLEAALKDIHSKVEPLHQASKDSFDIKKKNDDISNKIDQLIQPLNKVNDQIQYINNKIDQIQQEKNENLSEKLSIDLMNTFKKFDEQLNYLNNHLPAMGDIPKQIDSLKDTLDKLKQNENNNQSSYVIKDIHDQLKHLDETIKRLSDQILSKTKYLDDDEEKMNTINLRQVPLSQSNQQNTNNLMNSTNNQIENLFTNLLILQTTIQNSDYIPFQDIQQYLKRIEQSSLIQNDRDLQQLVQHIKDLCGKNNDNNIKSNSNIQKSESNGNSTNLTRSLHNTINNSPISQQSEINNSENRRNENKMFLPQGYLTKSRYISLLSDQIIRNNWPKLSSRSISIINSIINQPLEFDNRIILDQLIKQNDLEQYALLTRNAIEKSDKDYDKISYMMDSIVFDQMTMIGCREALIRPWDPSLLNRASSKGFYPYPSGTEHEIERFQVNKDISLWMVETNDSKPYYPTVFHPNIERLNEKYERIQQPQFNEIRHKRREDETHWNERYAFTKDDRKILFVNDLRSYFMDYDTKRKYQVHDDVPINPVCRTGIAGRGDLPFWGPNHCVVIILLRNSNEPEVVLMRHHENALVLPKGFYGHEARYDNQIKIIQDPVSGQILPPNLFDYWWSNVIKLNEINKSINNFKYFLNDKTLKEEFAEIFSQKGCNKSVFDNGYVDHPLNTDHAWVESSIWKIQFKDWRIPEMRSAKYSIADDLKNNNNTFPFVWMKLIDAILIVPPFDRGILIDVLATGMPL